jgi:hypothetical protein
VHRRTAAQSVAPHTTAQGEDWFALVNCWLTCALRQPVPYRDSKLTMMFRDYFQEVRECSRFCILPLSEKTKQGAGRAAMVVNVNPQVADYDETARVMKFSAMAQVRGRHLC